MDSSGYVREVEEERDALLLRVEALEREKAAAEGKLAELGQEYVRQGQRLRALESEAARFAPIFAAHFPNLAAQIAAGRPEQQQPGTG